MESVHGVFEGEKGVLPRASRWARRIVLLCDGEESEVNDKTSGFGLLPNKKEGLLLLLFPSMCEMC